MFKWGGRVGGGRGRFSTPHPRFPLEPPLIKCGFVDVIQQKINILIVNQSIVDMLGSLVALLIAVVEVDGTRMEHHSAWHQFVCRIWLSRNPLWCLLVTSTYGIILTALERYIAVVYPIWYKVDRYTAKMSAYPRIFRAAEFSVF